MNARDDYPAITNGLLRSNRVYADEVYQLQKMLDRIEALQNIVDALMTERDVIHDRYDEMRAMYCAKVDELAAASPIDPEPVAEPVTSDPFGINRHEAL